MALIEIKHFDTGAVLYSHIATADRVASGLAMRDALEAACAARANLDGANLDGANLAGAYLARANLAGAYLDGAYLAGKRPILNIGPIGSRSAYLVAFCTDKGVMVRAGCFFGTRDEFAAACAKTHGDSIHGREYAAALALIDAHAALWEPAPVAEAA